jgi:hypothetical protein
MLEMELLAKPLHFLVSQIQDVAAVQEEMRRKQVHQAMEVLA